MISAVGANKNASWYMFLVNEILRDFWPDKPALNSKLHVVSSINEPESIS